MNEHTHKGGNFWLGFFLGGLIGAFIIFILGTKEGKKVYELLEDEEDKVKNKVKQEVVQNVQTAKKTIVDKLDNSLEHLQEVQKKGVELTAEVRNRFFKKNGKKLSA